MQRQPEATGRESVSPRIVSLLPSATEIVCALGLTDRLVGVTHECDYPPEVSGKPIVTRSVVDLRGMSSRGIDEAVQARRGSGASLYELDVGLLASLEPDLILTQGLCDVCAVTHSAVRQAVPALPSRPKVLSLSPAHLVDVLSTIKTIGDFTGQVEAAKNLITSLRTRLDRVALATGVVPHAPRVLCLEWLDPPWVAGHWLPEMVGLAGGVDGLSLPGVPSRRVSWDEVARFAPEAVVAMPCGFSLERTLSEASQQTWPAEWHRLPAVRAGRVWAVDASSYFSRPGPRLYDGVEILAALLHPEIAGLDVPIGSTAPLPVS